MGGVKIRPRAPRIDDGKVHHGQDNPRNRMLGQFVHPDIRCDPGTIGDHDRVSTPEIWRRNGVMR